MIFIIAVCFYHLLDHFRSWSRVLEIHPARRHYCWRSFRVAHVGRISFHKSTRFLVEHLQVEHLDAILNGCSCDAFIDVWCLQGLPWWHWQKPNPMGSQSSSSQSFPVFRSNFALGLGLAYGHSQSRSSLLHVPSRYRVLQHLLPRHYRPDEFHSLRTAQLAHMARCGCRRRSASLAPFSAGWTPSTLHIDSVQYCRTHPLRSLRRKLTFILTWKWLIDHINVTLFVWLSVAGDT